MGVARAAVPGLPASVEVLNLVVGHRFVGEQDKIGLGRVTEKIAIKLESFFAHVHGHADGRNGGQAGEFFHGIEVTQPYNLVGGVGHGTVKSHIYEPADVRFFVGNDSDPVGTQRPDLPKACFVLLQRPECGTPEAEVDFGGPPQVSPGVPRIDPLHELLQWMAGSHGL